MMNAYRTMVLSLLILTLNTLSLNTAYSRDFPDPETFDIEYLMKATVEEGMMKKSCGGYCIEGACAHFVWGFSLKRGFYYYTIISPKISHASPEFLVSSYNIIGEEPFKEWRDSFGKAMKEFNEVMLSKLSPPDGLQAGRPDPINLDQHQSATFKEVDIIGHPLAILPELLKLDGDLAPPEDPGAFKTVNKASLPPKGKSAVVGTTPTTSSDDAKKSAFAGVDVASMLDSGLISGTASIKSAMRIGLVALEVIDTITTIKKYADFFKTISDMFNTTLTVLETTAKGSVYGMVTNPKFWAPRLMCPNTIKPLQPYYLSFADAFYWRSGYPITDGPLSGDDYSLEILNPFTTDSLPPGSSPMDLLADVWGTKYPREGMINNNHDAKAASVTAWRAMDVLLTSVPKRARVGLEVKDPPSESFFRVHSPKWQLIFPEILQCSDTPYYPSTEPNDFIEPQEHGSYAWNFYRTYQCCSNNAGKFLFAMDFPPPFPYCLDLL